MIKCLRREDRLVVPQVQLLIGHIATIASRDHCQSNAQLEHEEWSNDSWNHRGKRYDRAKELATAKRKIAFGRCWTRKGRLYWLKRKFFHDRFIIFIAFCIFILSSCEMSTDKTDGSIMENKSNSDLNNKFDERQIARIDQLKFFSSVDMQR